MLQIKRFLFFISFIIAFQTQATIYYWIDNSGNWSDVNHWSLTSNGAPAASIPTISDTVVFDANSFTVTNQQVLVDIDAYFSKMTWATAQFNQKLKLNADLYANGDVILNSNLFVTRDSLFRRIEFNTQSNFDPASAIIDCNISILLNVSSQSVNLNSYLHMTDSTAFYHSKGKFFTLNNPIDAGTIQIVDTSATSIKLLNFSASIINLSRGFNADPLLTNFTFQSGTSNLYIGSTNSGNYLTTGGLTFNNVTIKFPPQTTPQLLSGNNTFKKLKILANSNVTLTASSIQTVNDSLIMIGTCRDSITIKSSTAGVQATIIKTNGKVKGECLNLRDIKAQGGAAEIIYFSTNISNNTNWNFSTSKAVTSNFTALGPFCYGDTTLFSNTSTCFSGVNSDFSTQWFFEDASTGYYANPPTDSTWISYELNVNKHRFHTFGSINMKIVTVYKNFCTDTLKKIVDIYYPDLSVNVLDLDTTICAGSPISFDLSSSKQNVTFQWFVNGVSKNVPSINDTIFKTTTLNHLDTVSFKCYLNGCIGSSTPKIGVRVNPLPAVSWTSTDADNAICLNESVTFTGSGANVYRYLINSSGVTPFSAITTYTTSSLANNDNVYIIGKNTTTGCTDTLNPRVFIVHPLPITTLTSSIAGNLLCAGDAVTFTAGGASQYRFYKNGVAVTVFSATNTYTTSTLITNDIITVEGKSAFGCTKMSTQTFSYFVSQLPTINLTSSDADNSICSSTNVSFTATGGALYEFFVNGNSQGVASSTATFNTSSLSNNDEVYVQALFSGCTNKSDTLIFQVFTAPNTTLTSNDPDQSICAQTNVLFTAGGATTYQFFVNGVSQGAASTTTTFNTSSLQNGNIISVIGTSNSCPVTASLTFTVLNIPNVPLFSNDADNTLCFGNAITLTSANCSTYELFVNASSQGAAQVSATFNPSLPVGVNSIYVKGTGANGCSVNSQPLSVTVNAIPTVVLTSSDANNTICSGESVTFTGAGSTLYQFYINGVSQGNMSATNQFTTTSLLNNQTISIIGSTLGCSANSNTLTFSVNAVPSVVLTSSDLNNIYCSGDVVTYSASGATNYEFFINNVSQGSPSTTAIFTPSGLAAGTYAIKVVGISNSCSSNATISAVINSLPSLTLQSSDLDNIICAGESVSYTAGGANLYEFKVNGVSQGNASTLILKVFNNLANNNIISVVGTSNQGCISTLSLSPITVNAIPIVSLTSSDVDDQICLGDAVSFTSIGASTYEYFLNGISQGLPTSSNSYITTSLVNNDQFYVKGYSSGCSAISSTIKFTVHSYPIVTLTNNAGNSLCTGQNTNITALGADLYQFLVNGTPTGAFSANNQFISSVNNGAIVSVKGQTFGCISNGTSSITFVVNSYPTLNVLSSDANNDICLNDLVSFTGSGAQSYDFSINGKLFQSNASNLFSTNAIENGDVVSVIGYNGQCASSAVTFTFVVHSMNLKLITSSLTTICNANPITFTASGADKYQFFVNGNSQGALSTSPTFTASNLVDLDEVTFTGYSNSTLCTQQYGDYLLIQVKDAPVITLNPNSLSFCDGDSILLSSNQVYGNQWLLNGAPIVGATDTFYVANDSGVYSLEETSGGNGKLWSFGLNAQGTFGDSTNFNHSTATPSVSLENFNEISSGKDFMMGITNSGALFGWGENSSGQLGNGTYTNKNYPIKITAVSNIKTVATSESSVMAVTNSGTVYVWGNNNEGQLATGNTSVINFPFLNTNLTNVDSIAGGKNHFVILKKDGTVWTVGNNDYGQLGKGNLLGSKVLTKVTGLSNIVKIGAGEYQSFAIENNGDLYVWGNNASGQLGLNDINNRLNPSLSSLKNIINVQGGAKHSLFLSSNNKVYASGANDYGQLGTGDFSRRIEPTKIDISGVEMISAGQYTSLIKRADKSVFGFGINLENQLSTISGISVASPTYLPNLYNISFVEAGSSSSYFISNGSTSCGSTNVSLIKENSVKATISLVSNNLVANSGVSYQWYFEGSIIPNATNQTLKPTAFGFYTVEVTYAGGCKSESKQFAYGVEGLNELSNYFKLYPNPTNGSFIISSSKQFEMVEVFVKDVAGRLIKSINLTNLQESSIDLSSFSDGIYGVELLVDGKISLKRNIVKSNF